MKFVFLTAIRVEPKHWIAWRQHLSTLFARNAALTGFTCHTGERSEVLIGRAGVTGADQAPDLGKGQMLAALKAQDLYDMDLSPLGDRSQDSATLVVLKTGELCRIDFVDIPQAEAVARHAEILSQIRAEIPKVAQHLAPFTPKGIDLDQLVVPSRIAIHTLISFDILDPGEAKTVSGFLQREGLELGDYEDETRPFTPGWSSSALARLDITDILLFAAVVMRVQCVWYQQRGQRDFCIDQTSLLAQQQTVETDISSSHEVVRRLFDFTVWGHELREFSTNLKPWLKVAFDELYAFWDMADEHAYVEKTLRHAHELLASGYQSRMLIQERQQSRLLFVIAAVGLLGIAGSLMSIWTALSWGMLVESAFWTSKTGKIVLLSVIGANFLGLCIVLYRFVVTQFK